jgi:hypothetical protein
MVFVTGHHRKDEAGIQGNQAGGIDVAFTQPMSVYMTNSMDPQRIQSALADITAEQDPTLKSAKLASLCSALWAESGVELVVVGGSAIEILTEGAYASGDLDMCHVRAATLPMRERQEVMGLLGAKGGPRNWQVAGMYLDLLGPVESFARTPFRQVEGPYGKIFLMKPEDLLVERVLVSFYLGQDKIARACAKILTAVALRQEIQMNWPKSGGLQICRNIVTCRSV